MYNGELIKTLRLQKGLSQCELGQMIGKDRYMICKFETNQCAPNFDDLHKIAQILGCKAKDIYNHNVATLKTNVATRVERQPSVNTYKLSVRLSRRDFTQLTKDNLRKVGYKDLKSFVAVAYEDLCNRLKILQLGGNDGAQQI